MTPQPEPAMERWSTTFERYGVVSAAAGVFVHYACGEHCPSPSEHDRTCLKAQTEPKYEARRV